MEHPIFGDVAPYVQNDEVRKRSDNPPTKQVDLSFPARYPDNKPGPRTPFHGNLSVGLPSKRDKALSDTSQGAARRRLHTCLQDVATAQAEVDRVKRAEAIVNEKKSAASAKAGRAETALKKARKANAPIDVADSILRGVEPAPSAVRKAKAALDSAEADWERCNRQLKQLEPEILAVERALSAGQARRDAAIVELVALSVGTLLAEYHSAQQRLAEVENALKKINANGCGLLVNSTNWSILPSHWDGKPSDFRPDQTLALQWRDWIESLKSDPEALLPVQSKRNRIAA